MTKPQAIRNIIKEAQRDNGLTPNRLKVFIRACDALGLYGNERIEAYEALGLFPTDATTKQLLEVS